MKAILSCGLTAFALTLYAAGNSCNGDGQKTGDQATVTMLEVAILGGAAPDAGSSDPAPAPPRGCSVGPTPGRSGAQALLLALLFCARFCLRARRSTRRVLA